VQASRDIDEIVISSKKVTSRAAKIEELELDKVEPVVKLVVEN
jgi:hypothetical protein